MGNRHFRALSVAVLAGAAICLSWWLCDDGNGGADLRRAEDIVGMSPQKRIADDPNENAVVRKSASRALRTLDGL